ncbi:MAG TPA: LamG-like jellyroll fold domain-containing protein [Lacibacter sp.]|nr:LamG-like jellyroll fold domain-containing protein [Lacibacter sp.]
MNLTSGLVLHHPFNGNTNDVSGNAINGTANNVSLTTDRAGNANSAYYFSSINSYIELPYSNLYNFAPSGSFTISVWVLPDQGYSWPAQAVVVKSPPHPNYLASQWNYGTYLLNYKAMGGFGGNHILNGTTTLTSTQCWYNIVQTYNNGRWNMYVNGILESSDLTQTRFILQDAFSKIVYGKKGESDGDYYKGKIDDVRIYNRVVTADEIAALYNENNPCRFTNQVCSGSLGTPIVNITFGSGSTNPGPQIGTLIPGASTNYNYAAYATGNPPNVIFDGDYATVNAVPTNGAWFAGGTDHTGNPNGYMAFFNSAPTPGEFYRQTISGLCPGTTYEFSAWVANVINPSVLPGAILPNITFKILDPSTSAILGLFNSGDIPMSNSMTWRQYSFLFLSPAATNSVTLVLENNNIGGNAQPGNDLALDDITFRPCGPTVTASPNTTSSCAGQAINLSGNLTGTLNNPSFQWQISNDGGNTFSNISGASTSNYSLSGLAPGNYKLLLLAAQGANINSPTCRFLSNIIDVTITSPPSTIAFNLTQPDCTSAFGTVTVTTPTGTGFEYSINGSNYQTSNQFSNISQGNYSLTVRNSANGCVSVPSPFTVNTPPAIPSAPQISPITQPNCTVTTASFTVLSPIGSGLEYSINGTTYQTNTDFSGIIPGNYNLTVRNVTSGCTSPAEVIYINPPPLALGMPTLALEQPTCTVPTATIYVLMNGSPLEYSLNGGSYQSSNIYTSLTPGNYTITVRNTNTGCVSMMATAVINPVPLPPAAPVIGNIIHPTCSLPSGSIEVSSPSGTDFRYSINGANFQTSPNFTNIAPGNHYAVVLNHVTGCVSSQAPFIINSIPPQPPVPDVIITQQPSCTNSTGSILINSPVSNNYEYSINGINFQSSPIFNNLDTGVFLVTVRDRLNGCLSIPASIRITADATIKGGYYLPNAFTPNNDGLNDCFGIKNWGLITEFKLTVYNRWGEEVFSTTNPSKCWDGTYKGLQQNPGNYVYYIKAVSLCGTVERKGNLALIR